VVDLSPAAQAVLDAMSEWFVVDDQERQALAAALRAAADQVVPPDPCGDDCCIDLCVGIRAELLAIAAELEAQ
jgi:hypothetical protein